MDGGGPGHPAALQYRRHRLLARPRLCLERFAFRTGSYAAETGGISRRAGRDGLSERPWFYELAPDWPLGLEHALEARNPGRHSPGRSAEGYPDVQQHGNGHQATPGDVLLLG